ncbi:MAG: 16S rRNA processing protein RimM [Bdellovibrio sp.]|nr:16S rRNA processing protein RimM [Bdellovibrio sp.]
MRKQRNELILMGYCPNPHGVHGGFSFFPISRKDSILQHGMEVFLKKSNSTDNSCEPYKIAKINKGNKWILFFDQIIDRNQVESLTPAEVYCAREAFPKLESKSEFYLADLIGLKIYSFETGDFLGKCLNHYHNGAQYVLVLKLQNETIELPFIDYFFPEINLARGEMRIRMPEVISE